MRTNGERARSSQEPPVIRRWPHKLYLAVTSLILLGILSEGVLIGPSLFAGTGIMKTSTSSIRSPLAFFYLNSERQHKL